MPQQLSNRIQFHVFTFPDSGALDGVGLAFMSEDCAVAHAWKAGKSRLRCRPGELQIQMVARPATTFSTVG